MLIIVWTIHVIDPSVSRFDRVERVLRTGRERSVIRVNSADFENPGWRAIVSFDLSWTAALPNNLAASPSQSVLTEEYLHCRTDPFPSAVDLLQALQFARHAVPSWCDPYDELSYRTAKLRCCKSMIRRRKQTKDERQESVDHFGGLVGQMSSMKRRPSVVNADADPRF
jgi:hypothetical protein